MEERLKEGFTLIMSGEYGRISGGYLKKGDKGMVPAAFIGSEVETLESFPSVLETLNNEKILQLYSIDDDVVACIGTRQYEALYAEKEYLDIQAQAREDSVLCVLEKLNLELSNHEEKEEQKTFKRTRKAYKLYGSDKYKLEEN